MTADLDLGTARFLNGAVARTHVRSYESVSYSVKFYCPSSGDISTVAVQVVPEFRARRYPCGGASGGVRALPAGHGAVAEKRDNRSKSPFGASTSTDPAQAFHRLSSPDLCRIGHDQKHTHQTPRILPRQMGFGLEAKERSQTTQGIC